MSTFAHLTATNGVAAMPPQGEQYAVLFKHGTLDVGWYAPRGVDDQEPHERDELYVIATGRARFWADGDGARDVGTGDVLFVAAHVAHRFEEMSSDFGTWVFFYGPAGGEVEPTVRWGADREKNR